MTTRRSRSIGVSPLLFALVLSLSFAVSFGAIATQGQAVATGTITGTVLDPQNAAVAGATVTLVDKSGGEPRTTSTTDTGRFVFTQIAPGNYDVNVTKQGFATAKLVNQNVSIGQELRLDVNLRVGAASETIEVTAVAGADLQTMNSSVGQTIKADQLLMLPNFGRDASTLATLQPATNPTGEVAGAAADQNSFQLDGANNSNDMDGTMTTYTPSYASNGAPTGVMPTPVESIEEFKVNTNNQTADFNASAGGQVMMATKKGSNAWHGGLWEYYTDARFGGANNWNNDRLGLPITDNHQNRFGGNVGGAILPKFLGGKTYFFGEYDGRRFPNASQIEFQVPTPLLRAGVVQVRNTDGSVTPINLNNSAVTVGGTTYQPTPCPGGAATCDPRNKGINPLIQTFWNKFEPLPNDPNGGDTINTQGYISNILLPQRDDGAITRIDHDFGEKWHAMLSYHWYGLTRATTNFVDIGGFFSGDQFGVATSKSNRPQQPSLVVGGLTTNATSNVTNDIHFSYLRNWWQWGAPTVPAQIAGVNNTLFIGGTSGNSNTSVQMPFFVDNQDTRTRFWDGQDKMFRDDVSWLKGNHLFQFGALYQRNYLQHQRNDNGGTIQATPFPVAISQAMTSGGMTGFIPTCGTAGVSATDCIQPGSSTSNYRRFYSEALGIISQTQELFSRAGSSLTLQPNGTPALEQSVIPTYNVYFTDSWHMKPTFTLTYGLGWQIEMPPVENNGNQSILVDDAGNPLSIQQFLSQQFASDAQGVTCSATATPQCSGNIYNPLLGFATIRNVAGNQPASRGEKYPYHPFYKGLSPRLSFAWNPNFDSGLMGKMFGHGKTVIRGGYGRVYGRLNGVGLILVPLLAPGALQATSCQFPTTTGTCAGSGGSTPSTAFRIGDAAAAPLGNAPSTTLPQPFFPGVNGAPGAGAGEALDPNFRPNQSDEFDLTIQHQLSGKMIVEVGYIGRRIRNEYQAIDTAAVPYMLSVNGQQFQNAWANLYNQVNTQQGTSKPVVTAQPWFEGALGGGSSAYCSAFSSCTAAVASKLNCDINQSLDCDNAPAVYDLIQSLSTQSSWQLGRIMASSPNCVNTVVNGTQGLGTTPVPVCQQFNAIGLNGSSGYGNYNAVFVSLTSTNWHGFTARSNLTYGRSLGTQSVIQASSEFGVPDPWNLHNGYGPQPFDFRFVYNFAAVYSPSLFKGQTGWKRAVLAGWSISPLFTVRSGTPLEVNISQGTGADCQSFGESDCSFNGTDEGAVFASAAGITAARGFAVSEHSTAIASDAASNPSGVAINANPSNNGVGLSIFGSTAQAVASYNAFRAPILGIDTNPGSLALRGMPNWNLDMTVAKDFRVTERFGLTFIAQFTNILNHFQPSDPGFDINDPNDWGVIGTTQVYAPRSMELGLRFHF